MTDSRSIDRACGCPDFEKAQFSKAQFNLSRRQFLAASTAATGVMVGGSLIGDAFRQVSFGAEAGGNVLVVLSLRGGSDGLSMVVPRLVEDRDVLNALRPGINVPVASLIAGNSTFGLHPEFAPLLPMWHSGSFGAVQSVGLPAPNRSHFDAMEVIEDADPGSSARTGWINRMIGLEPQAHPETAVGFGSTLLPTSLIGPAQALGAYRVTDLDLPRMSLGAPARRASLAQMWASRTDALGLSVQSTIETTARLAPLVGSAADDAPGGSSIHASAYPAGPLRQVLANTAALIRADVGTKVVTVDYGDWDMHTGLGEGDNDPTTGWMAEQVRHLAGSLAAFFDDLGDEADRVTVVTISEFGRRVEENGDHGVDHGYGNAMLLLGAGVNGGDVHGTWPGLNELDDGDLKTTRDYRSVLWEVLASRFPDVSGSRSTIFPGFIPEDIGTMV